MIKKELWKNLSAEEIRLYFLLIIKGDKNEGKGSLSLGEINHHLGLEFTQNDLKKAVDKLQKFHLIKITSFKRYHIQFELKFPEFL